MEFALEDARKCLPHDSVDIHLAFATTLVVLWPDSISSAPTTFRFGSDSSYGALLVAPGRTFKAIYPTAGPSALIPMLGQAAAVYFQKPACDPFRE